MPAKRAVCVNCGLAISSYHYAQVPDHWMHDDTHRSNCYPLISARPDPETIKWSPDVNRP